MYHVLTVVANARASDMPDKHVIDACVLDRSHKRPGVIEKRSYYGRR